MSYNTEIIEKKAPIKQLDLFSDLLNETKGFKYQITLKVMLKNTNPMEKLNLDQFISMQQKENSDKS